jgi:hypothetical protein
LEGRYFAPDEEQTKPHVVIINRSMAHQYFPGQDPVGMRINYDSGKPEDEMQIVGMIDHIREGPLDEDARAAMYIPFEQHIPWAFYSLVARTSVDAESMLPVLASTIHQIDPGLVTFVAATMNQRIHDSPAAYLHRASASLVGAFATLALVLSAVGLYGVIAYSVSQRTREIGVRIALGAQRSTIYQLVLKEATGLIGFGIVIGLLGSIAAATSIRKLLFGTQPWDAFTLTTVAVVLGVSALIASFLPARRAAMVDPAETLRAE